MNARDEIRRVLDLGIGLIKIHPPHQLFSPNAYRGELWQLAEIYRECEARNVPVMVHTGTSVFRARATSSPIRCRSMTSRSTSNLKIILAHAGRPLYGETAFFLVRRHPNVYADISGIPPKSLPRFVPRLADIADKVRGHGLAVARRGVDAPERGRFARLGWGGGRGEDSVGECCADLRLITESQSPKSQSRKVSKSMLAPSLRL
jgi:hypothetical protein